MVLVCDMISQDYVIKSSCDVRVSCHHVEFGSYKLSNSRDMMVFVCQVTLQDHVIKIFYEFVGRSPLR